MPAPSRIARIVATASIAMLLTCLSAGAQTADKPIYAEARQGSTEGIDTHGAILTYMNVNNTGHQAYPTKAQVQKAYPDRPTLAPLVLDKEDQHHRDLSYAFGGPFEYGRDCFMRWFNRIKGTFPGADVFVYDPIEIHPTIASTKNADRFDHTPSGRAIRIAAALPALHRVQAVLPSAYVNFADDVWLPGFDMVRYIEIKAAAYRQAFALTATPPPIYFAVSDRHFTAGVMPNGQLGQVIRLIEDDMLLLRVFVACFTHGDGVWMFDRSEYADWTLGQTDITITRKRKQRFYDLVNLARDIAAGRATFPEPPIVDPPVVEPPPPAPARPVLGGQLLAPGLFELKNTDIISADFGILANNGVVVSIDLSDVNIDSTNYGIYAAPSSKTVLTRVRIRSAGGGNAYCVRGVHERYESVDCEFHAAHSWRIYGCSGGFSKGDIYDVNYLRIGGGAANGWESELPFGGTADQPFTFADCLITARSEITIHDGVSHVLFVNVDFAGTPKIFIDEGAKNIEFRDCINMPRIQHKANLTTLQAEARGIRITATASPARDGLSLRWPHNEFMGIVNLWGKRRAA